MYISIFHAVEAQFDKYVFHVSVIMLSLSCLFRPLSLYLLLKLHLPAPERHLSAVFSSDAMTECPLSFQITVYTDAEWHLFGIITVDASAECYLFVSLSDHIAL